MPAFPRFSVLYGFITKKGISLVFLLIACGLISCMIVVFQLDLRIADQLVSGIFAQPWNDVWIAGIEYPWLQIYRIAQIPSLVLSGWSLIVVCGSIRRRDWKKYRKAALFLLVSLLVGPGLLVNVLLKDNLGRPRPHEVLRYGGDLAYSEAWIPGEGKNNSSFPSGHAAVAYFLMAPFFLFRRSNPLQAAFFLGIGLFWGSLVGLARMIQGGHFFSDVLWSACLVYVSCALVAQLMGLDEPEH